ncbi:MAG: hypothetical protein HQL16_03270 [Candidatus Omnitrophica bacterium]|nr:hypothetical protein [Candidatus Omnitrophota bacterium]
MPGIVSIFAAVFFAGVVSLLLELSLLREFVYIFGSTATSNALIISVFLVGLATGSYAGTWRKFKYSPREAKEQFAALQIVSIIYIIGFFFTKKFFIYHCHHPKVVMAYFLVTVFFPAFLSGLGYAFIVKVLHERGERLIVWVYGISTLGSVIGGILQGLVLVPLWGMRSAYMTALVCAALAGWLIARENLLRRILTVCLALSAVGVVFYDPVQMLFPSRGLLFSKDSQFGIVEVWQMTEDRAKKNSDRIGFGQTVYKMSEPAIDIKINNVHQAYNLPVDRHIHEQWAATSLAIVGHKAKVLLMGYASGVTAEAYLSWPNLERLDIIENCGPVVEAGKKFFPKEYAKVMNDPRAHIIVDDFRGYARFTHEKYDVIALDHSLQDPYQIGFFTTEFFGRLKDIMNDQGVVILLGGGLSWNTTRLSFPYIYKNNTPGIEPHIQHNCLYMATRPFRPEIAANYALIMDPLEPNGIVYSDERVWRTKAN